MDANAGRTVIKVAELADSSRYGYEQCLGVGNLVFVAGQVGVDKEYNVVAEEFIPQCRQTFMNVKAALAAAGCEIKDIVSMTVFLTHLERDFQDFVTVRKEFMVPASLPTSAVIGCARLAYPSLAVEIQAIAVRPGA